MTAINDAYSRFLTRDAGGWAGTRRLNRLMFQTNPRPERRKVATQTIEHRPEVRRDPVEGRPGLAAPLRDAALRNAGAEALARLRDRVYPMRETLLADSLSLGRPSSSAAPDISMVA
jgi:hypothetical protein